MYYLFEPGKHPCEIEDVPMPNEVPAQSYLNDGISSGWYIAKKKHTSNFQLWVPIEDKDLLARLNTQLLLVL